MSEPVRAADSEPLSLGERVLERYRITERLALGGHSVVYRGEDERLSRPVCVKVFHKIADREGVWQVSYEHFVQEAFALSKLTHPNTLRIYDFGYLGIAPGADVPEEQREAHPPFQVSEYMDGGTLSQRVRLGGPVEHEEAIAIMNALCGALSEAHQHGIVHRDIKPKNILFARAGGIPAVKLADFGIAKSRPITDDEMQYRAGDTAVIAGKRLMMLSPSWAAPEQLTGKEVGPETDTYSLALIAIFMLTGRVVFAARTGQEAYDQRKEAERYLDAAFDGTAVPPAAVELLEGACSWERGDRPRDIVELGRRLADALRAKLRAPTHLTPVPPEPAQVSRPAPPPPPSPRRVHIADGALPLPDRRGAFVPARDGVADVTGAGGRVRARLTMMPGADGPCLHVKALNCFVALAGGRPSPAVQLVADGAVDFVLPNQQQIARAQIGFGSAAAGHTMFDVGGNLIALPFEDSMRAVAVDFGAGAECLLVYMPATSAGDVEASRSGWRRRRGTGRKS